MSVQEAIQVWDGRGNHHVDFPIFDMFDSVFCARMRKVTDPHIVILSLATLEEAEKFTKTILDQWDGSMETTYAIAFKEKKSDNHIGWLRCKIISVVPMKDHPIVSVAVQPCLEFSSDA